MSIEDKNILNYNHGEMAMKIPFNIYADMEYLLEKIDKCQSNLGKSSTTKINEHATSGNDTINKCRWSIISWTQCLLYMQKKNLVLMINIMKSKIITIIMENIELLLIVFVI